MYHYHTSIKPVFNFDNHNNRFMAFVLFDIIHYSSKHYYSNHDQKLFQISIPQPG